MSTTEAAIALRGVEKHFDGRAAVCDLTLTVPRGSVYGFIGPNGSGKTTTLRMIMNIFLADRGEIEVLGETSHAAARERVGYLPEERGLYKRMTVRQVLRYFGELKGMPRQRLERSMEVWLERLGARDWADRRVEALSKGMAQKVQFAVAVVAEPELLILDEPFTGLDPVNADLLRDAVLAERQRGATIVFSTHDMEAAERLCDRIFMIFRGRKVLDGTLEEIKALEGVDRVRVRTAGGRSALDGLPGIESVVDHGNAQDVTLRCEPQAFLRRLVERTTVHAFEVTRPSLHDIFVRIARPEADPA